MHQNHTVLNFSQYFSVWLWNRDADLEKRESADEIALCQI